MKFEIKSRWDSTKVIFEAEIECAASASEGIKLGLAVRAAYKSGADLSGADLRGAYLSGADLSGANLRGADLRDAYLSGANLSGAYLSGANLIDADLSGANLSDADLRDAYLSGADLSGANLRGADLSGANLSDADLRGAYLRGAYLSGANLSDADLSGADLSGANLSGANLSGADLSGAYLSGANLSGACPVKIENIHQKVYAAASLPDALDMGSWHAEGLCGTTHCRAGWVVHLAGEGGRALEWAMGTPAAAALIYMTSDPKLENVPDFHCGNEEALADMKRLAEEEAGSSLTGGPSE